MRASVRKGVVFGTIVVAHAAAIFGLAHIKTTLDAASPHQPIAVRMIASPQDQPAPKPTEVKTSVPTVSIEPPVLPQFDLPPPAEEPVRAITVPAQMTAALSSQADRGAPKLISTVEYVREPSPRYPSQSRKLREQGLVMLRVLIDEKGNACSIEIETSSGHARLDHAAREAVARAAFRPYVEDGEPRRAVVLIPIEFYLNRSSA